MVIVLGAKELRIILHALIEEHDRVMRGGGDQYGSMTLEEMNALISKLQEAL